MEHKTDEFNRSGKSRKPRATTPQQNLSRKVPIAGRSKEARPQGSARKPVQNEIIIAKATKTPYLPNGTVIHGKFKVEKMIGAGGFGQIYKAVDDVTRIAVAVKVVPTDHEPGRMILEQRVLISLRGYHHVPQLIASGNYDSYFYIVMEMLGRNLSDLKKKTKLKRFTIGTVLRVGQQALLGIKAVHDVGFLHRDVKPSNMCIGLDGMNRRTIYLVDFGMTRQYRNDKVGGFRKERAYAGFRGTMRYVSLTVHDRKEQGPVDDFWSLYYSIIELGEGSLPWRTMTEPEDIKEKKRTVTFEEMCRYIPRSVKDFARHLEELRYNQMPNYSLLTSVLQKAIPKDVSSETPFDWEDNSSLLKEVEKKTEEESS
uniref:Protein kinase domain-containing protein n=1 Tax=Panagrolaimus sp. JU765 TaxID=591449 RepID=A0AC34QYM9_9BILA